MPNHQIPGHPMVGTTYPFRPDLPPYDGDRDTTPGVLIVGNGMPVVIKAVFQNWNGVPGLDMLYVFCTATGQHTHITPRDLGLTGIWLSTTHRVLTEAEFDAEFKPLTFEDESTGVETKDGGATLVDREVAAKYPANRVWTVVDTDEGACAMPGYHHVNRFAYMVTEVPWFDDGITVEFDQIESDVEDEDEEER